MLIVLAVLSMALGNVVAIAQTNIKRMLAYSTISHVGFIFWVLLAGTSRGLWPRCSTRSLRADGGRAFGMCDPAERKGSRPRTSTTSRGSTRSPWLAFMMLMVLFSMAGVPPTVGFFAKLFGSRR
jgi:NADH-quinone oxidoreductase subunit N